MDKILVCGTSAPGSIPGGSTAKERPARSAGLSDKNYYPAQIKYVFTSQISVVCLGFFVYKKVPETKVCSSTRVRGGGFSRRCTKAHGVLFRLGHCPKTYVQTQTDVAPIFDLSKLTLRSVRNLG